MDSIGMGTCVRQVSSAQRSPFCFMKWQKKKKCVGKCKDDAKINTIHIVFHTDNINEVVDRRHKKTTRIILLKSNWKKSVSLALLNW